MIKTCFLCKGKGHLLSNHQYRRLASQYKNEKTLSKKIKEMGMECDLCKGTGIIEYPHIETLTLYDLLKGENKK